MSHFECRLAASIGHGISPHKGLPEVQCSRTARDLPHKPGLDPKTSGSGTRSLLSKCALRKEFCPVHVAHVTGAEHICLDSQDAQLRGHSAYWIMVVITITLYRNEIPKSSRLPDCVRQGPNTAIRQVLTPPRPQEHAGTAQGLCRDCWRVSVIGILRIT